MGLDMYLYKKNYVKNWEHQSEEEKHSIKITKGGKETSIKSDRIIYIIEEAGYWRKANAIHQWFVDNVQKGEDDCGNHYVSSDDLKKLLDTVNTVLASTKLVDAMIENGKRSTATGWEPIIEKGKTMEDATVAKKLLPSTSGFFFGSTDYNQYYYEDLQYTSKLLTDLLAEGRENAEFEYHSSW